MNKIIIWGNKNYTSVVLYDFFRLALKKKLNADDIGSNKAMFLTIMQQLAADIEKDSLGFDGAEKSLEEYARSKNKDNSTLRNQLSLAHIRTLNVSKDEFAKNLRRSKNMYDIAYKTFKNAGFEVYEDYRMFLIVALP